MKIFNEVLPDYSFDLFQKISTNSSFNNFYLAGGTSLALQLGHRESIDLDFFTNEPFTTSIMNSFPAKYEVIRLFDNSIEIFAQDTKIMFFYFAFPLYKPLMKHKGMKLAHPIDIGLMKLLALQGRTTKKDIIDLYFIDQKIIALEKLLEIFEKIYPKEGFNSYSSIKLLFDENLLKSEPLPKMFHEINWEECFELVTSKVLQHINKLLNGYST
ncbi:MAG: hypothetical protein KatS3mg085_106 [Candidatus Dojkabacteria bacterium]|nr:MAG: hypothetical protein KatS3mg085_106 [Candidatus Dojkabacteria bacterium]